MAAFTFSPPEVGPYYALFILTVFFGTFTTPIIYSRAVAGWFEKGRGSALGFSSGVGNGAGAALIPILAGLLLAHYGWRGAYQGVALLVLAVGFPIVFFCLRDPPRSARPGETNDPGVVGGYRLKAALKTLTFWVMALAIGVCASCLTAMFTQIVPIALSRGLSLAQGITIITVFSLTCAVWQWVMGLLLDRIQTPWILMPFYALAAIGLLLLQYGDSTALLVLSGMLMGLGLGAEYSALPLMASRYFGLRNYGQIVLLIYSGIAIFRGLVPWLINLHFDISGSYNLSLHVIQGVLILAAASLVLLPRLSKEASTNAA